MSETLRWTRVASFDAVYEAEQAVSILKGAGIAATLGDDPDAPASLASGRPPLETVALLVPEGQAMEARELLTVDPPEV